MKKGKIFEGIVTIFIIAVAILIITTIVYLIYSEISYGSKEGIITNKRYVPAHTYTTTTTSYVDGRSVNIPVQNYRSDSYSFIIQKEVKGKIKSISVNVTYEEFNKYNIGDYFYR